MGKAEAQGNMAHVQTHAEHKFRTLRPKETTGYTENPF